MVFYRYFRPAASKTLFGVFLLALLFASPAYSVDTKDSEIFITGFNAYLKKDYKEAIENLSSVLEKYPDTPLRDMALLWLSRSHLKTGNQKEAGRYMAKFLKECPDSPLKGTVEDELTDLAAKYQQEESIPAQKTAKTVSVQAPGIVEPASSGTAKQPTTSQDEIARLAAEKAELERVAAAKAETDRKTSEMIALQKAELERAAAAKAETDRKTSEMIALQKAELERAAAAKAETDRKTSEMIALKKAEDNRLASSAAEQSELLASHFLRDQAVAEFKTVVDSYPGTDAAVNAKKRLKELGIIYPPAIDTKVASTAPTDENTNVLSVEVDRIAAVDFTLAAEQQTVELGKRFAVPFEVVNRGNSPDSFIFDSGLPKEYMTSFIAAAAPDKPLGKSPQLLPGERFNGLIQFEMPTMSIDGERKLFPIKVISEAENLISQSRPIRLIAKAPILRTLIKTDVTQASPGERIPYKLVIFNVGAAAAKEVSIHLAFPPQYEPVDPLLAGFKTEGNTTLVMSGLQLTPGESREIAFTMKLKDSALAKEELFLHVEMINTVLKRTDKFVSASVAVKPVSGFTVQSNSDKIIATPGQAVSVLLHVTNTGNVRDDLLIRPLEAGKLNYTFYLDMNRDGIRQPGEPTVSHIGPLAPGEVANLILEITTSASEKDGVTVPLAITLDSQNDPSKKASANLSIVHSRPVLNLTVAGKGGKVKPGEVNSFELSCVNVGSGMAKMVDVRSILPEQLELVATEPVVAGRNNGEYSWKFDELGSGENQKIRVSYRIKPGTAVGTSLALKSIIKYQDQVGNSY